MKRFPIDPESRSRWIKVGGNVKTHEKQNGSCRIKGSSLKIIVFSTIWRHVDNMMPAFDLIRERGGRVDALFFPFKGDPKWSKMKDMELDAVDVIENGAKNLEEFNTVLDKEIDSICGKIIETARERGSDCVILANNFQNPYNTINNRIKKAGASIPVIAFQHGLQQPWAQHHGLNTCDIFFVYGKLHLKHAEKIAQYGAIDVGLPKLDRLFGLNRSPGNEAILFSDPPQPTWPNERAYISAIQELKHDMGITILTRSHPMWGTYPEFLSMMSSEGREYVNESPISVILENARFAIGNHSTALLEAMQARVPTIVLPHHRWHAGYLYYEGVSQSLKTDDIVRTVHEVERRPEIIDRFLEIAVGGYTGDHSRRFCDQLSFAIEKLRFVSTGLR